ncbi:DUF2380 domain-containing protein, partial [Bradyrhizobium sp. UFLA 03-164]|nr:DUF2380 domain-containing protein [Bradyrhizobium uaiense]
VRKLPAHLSAGAEQPRLLVGPRPVHFPLQAGVDHLEVEHGELGADLVMTGVVQKVSNLILNINLYLRDVHTGQLVAAASAD